MARIFIMILAVLIPLAVVFTQWQSNRLRDFQKSAKTAEGQIIFADERVMDTKNQRKQFVVEYEFSVDGQMIEGYDVLEHYDLREALSLGSRVEVLYDPKNPRKNFLKLLLDRRASMGD